MARRALVTRQAIQVAAPGTVANLTAGNTALVLVVIVGSMFVGLYLVQLSYAYMIFFVTIMVGQLYSVLHEFSNDLLVLRLEETAIGAVAGFAVALVVVPLSTRDTVRSSTRWPTRTAGSTATGSPAGSTTGCVSWSTWPDR